MNELKNCINDWLRIRRNFRTLLCVLAVFIVNAFVWIILVICNYPLQVRFQRCRLMCSYLSKMHFNFYGMVELFQRTNDLQTFCMQSIQIVFVSIAESIWTIHRWIEFLYYSLKESCFQFAIFRLCDSSKTWLCD